MANLICSSLSIGDCSAGGSFDTQAEENLKKSIAASIGLDDWTLINIKSASCDGSTASGRRLAGGGNFMIKFDITVLAPASTAAGTPAVASLTPDSRLDASALQSTSFLSKLATNYNTAQAETGAICEVFSHIENMVQDPWVPDPWSPRSMATQPMAPDPWGRCWRGYWRHGQPSLWWPSFHRRSD